MTGIDISKIKPGDEVTVRLTVQSVHREGPTNWPVRVCLNGAEDFGIDGDGNVRAEYIATHTPKALAVGDVVAFLPLERRVTIIAISGGRAWVRRLDGGSDYICDLRSLDRVS